MRARYRWSARAASAALLVVTACTLAQAGYDEGKAAYNKGDFDAALREWRPLAEQGDARAQKKLGDMYAGAEGVGENDGIAIQWYRKAAEQGVVEAQTSLGLMYESGQGVHQNHALAMDWYRRAAALKDPVGQSSLAAMYDYGLSVPRNRVVAYALYNLSPLNRFYAQALRGKMTKAQTKAGEELTDRLAHAADFLKALDQATGR